MGIWGLECGMWNVECGMWNVECGMWNVECGMWNVGCGMWDVGCGMWDVGCGMWGTQNFPFSQIPGKYLGDAHNYVNLFLGNGYWKVGIREIRTAC
jgi:hypothetical protein